MSAWACCQMNLSAASPSTIMTIRTIRVGEG